MNSAQKKASHPNRFIKLVKKHKYKVITLGAILLVIAAFSKFHKTDQQSMSTYYQQPPTTVQNQLQGQQKDTLFPTFSKQLLSREMNYEEAAKLITTTGMQMTTFNFNLPDKYDLLQSKKLYFVYPFPIILPDFFKEAFGTNILSTTSIYAFRTHSQNPQDGRIKALAEYILSKGGCNSPEDAVRLISSWVVNNLLPDVEHLTIPPTTFGQLSSTGYGVTHSHPNSINILGSTGVCNDYTNLAADLLNSVGIPSRTVTVMAQGFRDDMEGAKSLGEAIVGIFHTLLQANLPSGTKYFNVTPMYNVQARKLTVAVTEIGSPAKYIKERLEQRYSKVVVFRWGTLAYLPSDKFSSMPKEVCDILDKGMYGIDEFDKKVIRNKALFKNLGRILAEPKGDYDIFYRDVTLNMH